MPNAIENTAKAKGYENISAYIDGDSVEIIVKKDGFSDQDVIKLKDIASGQLSIDPSAVKIVEVK